MGHRAGMALRSWKSAVTPNGKTLSAINEATVRSASLGTAGSFSYLSEDLRRKDWRVLADRRQLCRAERASGGEIVGGTGIAIQARTGWRCTARRSSLPVAA